MTKVVIALTTAITIGGRIHKAGEQIEADQAFATELLRRGRGELVKADSDDSDDIETLDLSKMKKAELLELALEYDIENADSMTVAQLVNAIQAAAE